MRDGVVVEQSLVPVATVLELTLDGLGVVRLVRPGLCERPQRGTILGAEHHDDVGLARSDRRGELGDHMLRPLAADGFQHRPRRCGSDALGNRTRIVRGTSQRRHTPAGDLELPDADDGVNGARDSDWIGPGIDQRGRCRSSRQLHRRHTPVAGVVDTFGELPNSDEDRRMRIHHVHRHRTLCVIDPGGSPVPAPRWPTASCPP